MSAASLSTEHAGASSLSAAKVIFTGPSLAPEAAQKLVPGAKVEPPIRRGDLTRLCEHGHRDFLILDGVFAHTLAVAPSEIVDALRRGARITGAASLGALRAAECWPAGMQGSGAVHRLYRLGVIRDDDEVAVATDPSRGYAATTVALISIRYAVLAALTRRTIDRRQAGELLQAARATHFSQRTWKRIDRQGLLTPLDVKQRDAVQACRQFAAQPPAADQLQPARPRPTRSQGHHPLLGLTPAEAARVTGTTDPAQLPRRLIRWYAGQRLG